MARSLYAIVTHTKQNTGEVVWHIPEAYFLENGHWAPNDHSGLLWAQANLIYALNAYEQVFIEKPANLVLKRTIEGTFKPAPNQIVKLAEIDANENVLSIGPNALMGQMR